MKPERSFVAERIAAQHCAELLRAGETCAGPVDPLPAFARAGERFTRGLGAAFAPLFGGQAPNVACAAPRECDMATLAAESAPLAAHSLMAAGAVSLLVTLDAAAVLRIVDRTFGGKGVAPSPLPDAFPLSAEIMLSRLETLIAAQLEQAFGGENPVQPLRHADKLDLLDPFAPTTPLAVLELTVEEAKLAPWRITIALPSANLPALLGEGGPAVRAATPRTANPSEEPFGEVPLTLSAVVVDMPLAMSALAKLRPGTLLPVSVARSVPLKIGDKTVAQGSIGSVDDRVAIQIAHAF